MYLFLAALGLHCCPWAFFTCSRWELLFTPGPGHLAAVASPVLERRLQQLQLVGSRVLGQSLWRTGSVAPQHLGSSQTRDQTHIPCIGRQILNHWTTKEP